MSRGRGRASSPSSFAIVAIVVAGLVMLSGCRRPDRIDVSRANRQIEKALASTYQLPVERVRCPPKVTVETGAKFRCTARLDGMPITVEVTQRNSDGDLRVQTTSAVLVMSEVRADLEKTLADEVGRKDVKADCGPEVIRIVAPGGNFECKVTDGPSRRQVTVRVRDANGSITYTID